MKSKRLRLVHLVLVVSMLASIVPFSPVQAGVSRSALNVERSNVPRSSVPTFHVQTSNVSTFISPLPPPTATLTTTAPALLLAVSAWPESAAPGEVVTYTLILTNTGGTPVGAQHAAPLLSATLPDGLHWIPGQAGWTIDPPEKRLNAAVGELAPGAGVVLGLRLRASGPLDNVVALVVEARAGDEVLATTTASVWVAHPARATIGPEGGALRSSDGRVEIHFPPGALPAPVQVTYRPQAPTPGGLLRFALEAGALVTFGVPVSVSVFAPEFISNTLEADRQPMIELWDAHHTHAKRLRPKVNAGTGTVTAQVAGTGELVLGSATQVWKPIFVLPVAAMFSGAMTYQYPIEAPPGRNGLQPQLELGYNSRTAEGHDLSGDVPGNTDFGPVGLGWSFSVIDIIRKQWNICGDKWCYRDDFTLILNGAGYDLVAGGGQRYYAKGAPWLYIERRNRSLGQPSPVNETGEYWVVRLGDGTQIQLGYYPNSEQAYGIQDLNVCEVGCRTGGQSWDGNDGDQDGQAAREWHVDTMTDTFNNKITFQYSEYTFLGEWYDADVYSALWKAEYNHNSSGVAQTAIELSNAYVAGMGLMTNEIAVKNMDLVVRRYILDRTYVVRSGDGCTYTMRYPQLVRIRQAGRDGTQLPATTFTYTRRRQGCENSFVLTEASNGYGGRVAISYEQDGHELLYNDRVWQVSTYDGLNVQPAQTTYAYGTPCYDQWGGGVWHCPTTEPGLEFGRINGYSGVTQTVYGYAGETVGKSKHYFQVYDRANVSEAWRLGREYEVQQLDPLNGDALLHKVETSWDFSPVPSASPVTSFTYASSVTTTLPGAQADKVSRTDYAYDLDAQGYEQYGNLTAVYERGDTSTPADNRTIHRLYYPSTDPWIVNKLARETVYAGDHPSDDHEGVISRTRYRYDERCFNESPVKGALTAIDRWNGGAGNGSACDNPGYDTTRHTYDPTWGVLTSTSDPLNHTTSLQYDAIYLYPLQVTNALAHVTTLEYYGVNGVAADNGLPGQLKKETGPNGAATATEYRYDTFGRLLKIIRPDDSGGAPTTRYDYRDPAAWPALPNGGFENSASWYEWDPYNVQTYQYDTSQKHTGNRSLKIVSSGTADHWVGNQAATGWQAGRTYWLSAFVKTTSAGQVCLQLSAKVGHEASAGCVTATSDWQLVQGSVSLPDDATRCLVFLRTPQPGTLYVDDVQLGLPLEIGAYAKEDTAGNTHWSKQFYNGLGQVVQAQSEKDGALAVVLNQRYDPLGRLTWQSVSFEASGAATGNYALGTAYEYDPLGRVTRATAPDSTATETYYAGWQTAVIDAKDHQKISVVDAFGRLGAVKEYDGTYTAGPNWTATPYATTDYAYNVLDALTDVWDAADNHTQIGYDTLGRKTSMSDPDMGQWYYQYDAAGNLARQTDAKGQRTCFYYDALNRLKGKTYSSGTAGCPADPGYGSYAVKYYYDEAGHGYGTGRRTRMSNANDTTGWSYDARGRVTQESKAISGAGTFNTSYSYDAMDRLAATTYPSGEVIQHTYNAAAQLAQVRSTTYATNYASGITYNALGQITTLPPNNGNVTTYYTYDPLHARLRRQQTGSLLDLRYGYDLAGNVRTIYDATQTETRHFGYDALDRLLGWDTASTPLGQVAIRAKGDYADGWPVMQLRVNDVVVQEWTVDSAVYANYTAQAPLSGDDQVDVVFTNDYCVPAGCASGDRNLWVDYLVVNGQAVQVENDPAVRYDRGWGETAFDGQDVIAGQEKMAWAGALRVPVYAGDAWAIQEQYNYTAIGNLRGKAYVGYTYPASGASSVQPHAVRRVNGSGGASKTVQIRAYSTPCYDGLRATMELWVNGSKQTTWANVAGSWTTYSSNATLTGNDQVEVVFTNDCYIGGYDRNLYVDYVSVDGRTIEAEGGAAVIDKGAGSAAFDGLDVIGGQQGLYWDGALRFVVGAQAYAACYDANGNMTWRIQDGVAYRQTWDEENRLETVTAHGQTTTFGYDGDGRLVKKTTPGGLAYYVGDVYHEVSQVESDGGTHVPDGAVVPGEEDVPVELAPGPDDPCWAEPGAAGCEAWSVAGMSGEASLPEPGWDVEDVNTENPPAQAEPESEWFEPPDELTGEGAGNPPGSAASTSGLSNPGFESAGGWSEAGSSLFPGTSFYRSTWGTADQHTGSYAYAISNHAYGYLQSDAIAVSAGTQYDLYAWVHGELDVEDSHGVWLVRAYFYNSSGSQLGYKDVASGEAGTLDLTWQYKGGRLTTPANTASVRICLFDYMNSGWVAYDDVSLIQAGASTNLVTNPGFENPSGGWSEVRSNQFPGTSFYRGTSGTAVAHTGYYAYAISNHAYGYLQSDAIAVSAGTQYDLYAWVRGELDAEGSASGWRITACFYDANGYYINNSCQNADGGAGSLNSLSWQSKGGHVSAPANAATVRIRLYDCWSSGWVAYDDVSLKAGGGGSNLVPNPGFEGSTGWSEVGPGQFPGTSFYRSTWGTADQHTGSYAYAISNHAYGYLKSEAVTVSAGTQYDLYAWVRGELDAEDSEGAWLVRAYFYDSDDQYITYRNVASGGAGTLSTTWQHKGGRVTTPGGTATMRIYLFSYMNSGWVAYDDVLLARVTAESYYPAGGQRVAVRQQSGPTNVVYYLLSDHLGSTSLAVDGGGAALPDSATRYAAYGTTRSGGSGLPTAYRFTGQRSEESTLGLYFYNARWYDPATGRFISADTIVPDPQNPQSLNRYSYVLNSPVKYTDPTGYAPCIDAECKQVVRPNWLKDFYYDYFEREGVEIKNWIEFDGVWGFHARQGFTAGELNILYDVYQMFPDVKIDEIWNAPLEGDAGRYGSRILAVDVDLIKRKSPDNYRKVFIHTVAHETTHAWIDTTLEGKAAYQDYLREFWTVSVFGIIDVRLPFNLEEPTDYGKGSPEEAMCEVIALAVENPSRLHYYTWIFRDAGAPRREFVARHLPGVEPLR